MFTSGLYERITIKTAEEQPYALQMAGNTTETPWSREQSPTHFFSLGFRLDIVLTIVLLKQYLMSQRRVSLAARSSYVTKSPRRVAHTVWSSSGTSFGGGGREYETTLREQNETVLRHRTENNPREAERGDDELMRE